MNNKDYYQTLGVLKIASEEEIKKAYRKLAHQYHPDKPGGDAAKFKEINEAYQVLKDKDKRQQYDQFGEAFGSGNAYQGDSGFSGFDFSNFSRGFNQGANFDFDLGDLMGDFFNRGSSSRQRAYQQAGQDIEMVMDLDFKEAIFGAEKNIKIYKNVVCPRCNGNCAEPGTKIKECANCKGTGEMRVKRQTILGSFTQVSACSDCQGKGKAPEKKCSECKGNGITRQYQTIKVKIPAGIQDNQTLTLENQGEAGIRGGQSGDLYLHIRVKHHSVFARRGNDILSEQNITFSQAALGSEIVTETVDGKIKVKVPKATQSGTIIKLENKGVPYLQGSGRGSHLLKIQVATPKRLSHKMRTLFQEMAQEEGSENGAQNNKTWFKW